MSGSSHVRDGDGGDGGAKRARTAAAGNAKAAEGNADDDEEDEDETEVFVVGRVALFGEHADWHSTEMAVDSVEGGDGDGTMAIVCGTDQGLRARVRRLRGENKLRLKATTGGGDKSRGVEAAVDFDADALAEAAKNPANAFFAYQLATAAVWLRRPRVAEAVALHAAKGVLIDNVETTLPVKRGLSSSAAACVLLARALNWAFALDEDEMDTAYHGERATGSMCGRMDQLVAMLRPGEVVRVASFEPLRTERVPLANEVNIVLVSFVGEKTKDTSAILKSLRAACAGAGSPDFVRGINDLFSRVNARVCASAVDALMRGDAKDLGLVASDALAKFDAYAAPSCVEHLTAPALHALLARDDVASRIFGGKSVGAGGDGTALLVARSSHAADELVGMLDAPGAGTRAVSVSLR